MVKNKNNSKQTPNIPAIRYCLEFVNVTKNPNNAKLNPNPSIALDWNKSLPYVSIISLYYFYFKNLSKNYTPFKIENEIPTHEGAVAPARASLRSENEHRFNGKMLCSNEQPSFFGTHFSQIGFADFVKPYIPRLHPNFKFHSPALK